MRNFHTIEIEPEVVLADRWRTMAELASLFDSSISIWCRAFRRSVGNFCLFLAVQKLFECIHLAGNLAVGFHNVGFLAPKSYFVSTPPPKGASFQ
jgi:hypothetical protein